jgi:hypothetical protein
MMTQIDIVMLIEFSREEIHRSREPMNHPKANPSTNTVHRGADPAAAFWAPSAWIMPVHKPVQPTALLGMDALLSM